MSHKAYVTKRANAAGLLIETTRDPVWRTQEISIAARPGYHFEDGSHEWVIVCDTMSEGWGIARQGIDWSVSNLKPCTADTCPSWWDETGCEFWDAYRNEDGSYTAD